MDRSHNNGFKRINKNHSQSFSFPFYVALLEELNVFSVIAVIFILNKLLVKYWKLLDINSYMPNTKQEIRSGTFGELVLLAFKCQRKDTFQLHFLFALKCQRKDTF